MREKSWGHSVSLVVPAKKRHPRGSFLASASVVQHHAANCLNLPLIPTNLRTDLTKSFTAKIHVALKIAKIRTVCYQFVSCTFGWISRRTSLKKQINVALKIAKIRTVCHQFVSCKFRCDALLSVVAVLRLKI